MLNDPEWGSLETMALVTIALHCPPPLKPFSPLTSAPSKHNAEGVWVGQYMVDIAQSKDLECLSGCLGTSKKAQADSNNAFSKSEEQELVKVLTLFLSSFLFQWVCEHDWNLPRSAQVGPGLPLLA